MRLQGHDARIHTRPIQMRAWEIGHVLNKAYGLVYIKQQDQGMLVMGDRYAGYQHVGLYLDRTWQQVLVHIRR